MKPIFTILLFIWFIAPAVAGEHGHPDHDGGHAHAEEAGVIELSAERIAAAGIRVAPIARRPLPEYVEAPGAVQRDLDAFADVTARADGVVRIRRARLGDAVRKGQPLLTLESPALAQAQAAFLKARADAARARQAWQRRKALAEKRIVSQASLQQAESDWRAARASLAAARASLAALGMDAASIARLPKQQRFGRLTLKAPIPGIVTLDNFHIGQHVAAGSLLMQIADESRVWIEARAPASALPAIRKGAKAAVTVNGRTLTGRVLATHHDLDPATRTAGVRIGLENPDDLLHPGMFVQASIQTGLGAPALLAPASAVLRDGDETIVFVERNPGHFERREIRPGRRVMGMVVIENGLEAGERIVVEGAFALASELAKSGFAAHNH